MQKAVQLNSTLIPAGSGVTVKPNALFETEVHLTRGREIAHGLGSQ